MTIGKLAKQAGVGIKTLQSAGRKVAFVGDGINGAPAPAQAEVGIAVGSGTNIAIEAADFTLTRDDLGGVVTALDVARSTLTTIRGNLFWGVHLQYRVDPVPGRRVLSGIWPTPESDDRGRRDGFFSAYSSSPAA